MCNRPLGKHAAASNTELLLCVCVLAKCGNCISGIFYCFRAWFIGGKIV